MLLSRLSSNQGHNSTTVYTQISQLSDRGTIPWDTGKLSTIITNSKGQLKLSQSQTNNPCQVKQGPIFIMRVSHTMIIRQRGYKSKRLDQKHRKQVILDANNASSGRLFNHLFCGNSLTRLIKFLSLQLSITSCVHQLF